MTRTPWGSYPSECSCRKKRREARDEWERKEKIRVKNDFLDKLFGFSNLGERFRERTFSNYERELNPKAFDVAVRYVKGFEKHQKNGRGILFTGGVGSGKTHLAGAIANNLIKSKEKTVIFGTAINLLKSIKSDFRKNQGTIEEITSCDLLIIDDLGKEQGKPWVLETLFDIVNTRYERLRPIIITSNYPTTDLEHRLGDNGKAIVSRLVECCETVVMVGEDYRLRRGAR